MQVYSSIAELRAGRRSFTEKLGFVPTMGFLHEGHLSLVRRARTECHTVAVSIFVNPTQFAVDEDLDRYPRALERDLDLLQKEGVAFVFTPTPQEMYPPGFATSIDVGPVAQPLEGALRPGHFAGVATVVSKLFNIVQPTHAYFGQKDAQQCAVIRRMVRDLDIPVEIVIGDIVRSANGLALSSRNAYLNETERSRAVMLSAALSAASTEIAAGERDPVRLRAIIRDTLAREPALVVDYVSIADPLTMQELDHLIDGAVISLAVRVGATRLLDNYVVQF
ncbi:pantoate--beta-alanine ligase [Acetobacter estunensis NRIC 0472]|uniref:Pantothenate synthetase n=1 Tax=Acetobacter estunensis TaxID=104097 RepID=A0A967B7F8_9PROT|nr:pantoate--beta-alanine ligase [Acetobacter estunensis]NHO53461.1 pantoate--beta-alanine ligase [Acetobacter estunensis]GBQ29002.1 pantoate--beta-alanine ligase [Acetobacter estunensis NRIC 0472]